VIVNVKLQYPNRRTRQVPLAGIPRVGDYVQLATKEDQSPGENALLVVEAVTWTEGRGRAPDPAVIVSVRPRVDGPA
jgi:hypothetical protein